MLSDEWLQLEYTHSDRINFLDGLIDYHLQKDNYGSPIGISVNFEYADDVHYGDWVRFRLAATSNALFLNFSPLCSLSLSVKNKVPYSRIIDSIQISRYINITFKG